VVITAGKVMWRGIHRDFRGGSVSCYLIGTITNEPKWRVGWSEVEWYGSPCGAEEWQLAVEFSEAELAAIPEKTITRAILSFDQVEHPGLCTAIYPGYEEPGVSSRCWRSGGGAPEAKPDGCVLVRLPTADWRNGFGKTMVPFSDQPQPAVKKISNTQWDVSEPYRWRYQSNARPLLPPGQATYPPAGFGFLLTGTIGINGLEGEDSTACESQVSNLKLTVTIIEPSPDDPPFRQPR
jgi:hypothetical protein